MRAHRTARVTLMVAAVAGTIHGLFSIYWGFGGTWLLATVGAELAGAFADFAWVLILIGVAKIAAAVLPLFLATPRHRSQRPRWVGSLRVASWLGAAVLILWGGANTVTANLVLSGILQTQGYDRPGMAGHAWLWDPLFLLWGIALLVGLISSGGSAKKTR